VVFGKTTFGGVGEWTADADGGDDNKGPGGVKITSAAAGASIALVPGEAVHTTGELKATDSTPTITQAAGESNNLVIGAGITVDLDTAGSLVLTGAASDGAKLSGAGKVAFGNANITGGASGAWQAVGASTTITFKATTATSPSITGDGTSAKLAGGASTGAITVGTADGTTLTLTTAEINVAAGGSIVISKPSTSSNVFKFAGTDAIIGGLTGGESNRTLLADNITNATIDVSGDNCVEGAGTGGAGNASIKGKGNSSAATITVANTVNGAAIIDKNTLVGADA
jgi:hypothetical protein